MSDNQSAPYISDLEKSVLFHFIVSPGSIEPYRDILPSDWETSTARLIYSELLSMSSAGAESIIELVRRLAVRRPEVNWHASLGALTSGSGGSVYLLPEHVRMLRASGACRLGAASLNKAAELARHGDPAGAATAAMEASERFLSGTTTPDTLSSIGEAAMELWDAARSGAPMAVGFDVGLSVFDENFANQMVVRGRLLAIAARPGVGKTALSLQMAIAIAKQAPVTFWCGEMPEKELTGRVICSMADISNQRLMAGRLDSQELARMREAVGYLSEVPIIFSTKSAATMDTVNSAVAETASRFGAPGAIFLDYIQRMKARKKHANTEGEIAEVIIDAKTLARDHDALVVALCQLNRDLEKDPSRRMKMSDLRGSGQLEQDADAILGLSRPILYDENAPPRLALLDVMKNRHGRSGDWIPLGFDGRSQTFTDD